MKTDARAVLTGVHFMAKGFDDGITATTDTLKARESRIQVVYSKDVYSED